MIYLEKIISTAGTFTVGYYPEFIEKENPQVAQQNHSKLLQAVALVDPEEILEEGEELEPGVLAFIYLEFSEEDFICLPIFENTGFSVKT
jgi:hypothetical protein